MKLFSVAKSTVLFLTLTFIPSHGSQKDEVLSPAQSHSQNEPLKVNPLKIKNQFHESIIEKLNELSKEYKFLN